MRIWVSRVIEIVEWGTRNSWEKRRSVVYYIVIRISYTGT